MTIRVNRLARVLARLTVEERFDAVLNAYREDRPVSFAVATGLPWEDAARWNRMVGLLSATHSHLGWYVAYVEATVTQVELRFGILLGFHLAYLNQEQQLWHLVLDPKAEDERERIQARISDLEKTAKLADLCRELAFRWLEVRIAGSRRSPPRSVRAEHLHPEPRDAGGLQGASLASREPRDWKEVELESRRR